VPSRALIIAALVSTACAPGRDRTSECLCDSRFSITITPKTGRFAPDTYTFDLTIDGARTSEECVVAEPPKGATCNRNISPLMRDFEVVGFEVRTPAAKQIALTVRAVCATRVLAERTFEPTYGVSECGCSGASATITTDEAGSAFTICPDAATD
jgi:hypothetical protein